MGLVERGEWASTLVTAPTQPARVETYIGTPVREALGPPMYGRVQPELGNPTSAD